MRKLIIFNQKTAVKKLLLTILIIILINDSTAVQISKNLKQIRAETNS